MKLVFKDINSFPHAKKYLFCILCLFFIASCTKEEDKSIINDPAQKVVNDPYANSMQYVTDLKEGYPNEALQEIESFMSRYTASSFGDDEKAKIPVKLLGYKKDKSRVFNNDSLERKTYSFLAVTDYTKPDRIYNIILTKHKHSSKWGDPQLMEYVIDGYNDAGHPHLKGFARYKLKGWKVTGDRSCDDSPCDPMTFVDGSGTSSGGGGGGGGTDGSSSGGSGTGITIGGGGGGLEGCQYLFTIGRYVYWQCGFLMMQRDPNRPFTDDCCPPLDGTGIVSPYVTPKSVQFYLTDHPQIKSAYDNILSSYSGNEDAKKKLDEMVNKMTYDPQVSAALSNLSPDVHDKVAKAFLEYSVEVPDKTDFNPVIIWVAKKLASFGAGALVDFGLQVTIEKLMGGQSWESAWGNVDINEYQVISSGIEAATSYKYSGTILSAFSDCTNYLVNTPKDQITASGFGSTIGLGLVSGFLGDKAGDYLDIISDKFVKYGPHEPWKAIRDLGLSKFFYNFADFRVSTIRHAWSNNGWSFRGFALEEICSYGRYKNMDWLNKAGETGGPLDYISGTFGVQLKSTASSTSAGVIDNARKGLDQLKQALHSGQITEGRLDIMMPEHLSAYFPNFREKVQELLLSDAYRGLNITFELDTFLE